MLLQINEFKTSISQIFYVLYMLYEITFSGYTNSHNDNKNNNSLLPELASFIPWVINVTFHFKIVAGCLVSHLNQMIEYDILVQPNCLH